MGRVGRQRMELHVTGQNAVFLRRRRFPEDGKERAHAPARQVLQFQGDQNAAPCRHKITAALGSRRVARQPPCRPAPWLPTRVVISLITLRYMARACGPPRSDPYRPRPASRGAGAFGEMQRRKRVFMPDRGVSIFRVGMGFTRGVRREPRGRAFMNFSTPRPKTQGLKLLRFAA